MGTHLWSLKSNLQKNPYTIFNMSSQENNDEQGDYKAPAKKTLEELAKLDETDESLIKYKQALLGDPDDIAFDKNDPRRVIVTHVELHSPDLSKPVILEVQGNLEELKKTPIKIKEKSQYHIEVRYHVQHEIVSGLKYTQVVSRKGIKLDKDKVMMGSYGPRKEHYTYKSEEEEAPSGMMARGVYSVKSAFVDDDKVTHMDFDWKFEIAKDW